MAKVLFGGGREAKWQKSIGGVVSAAFWRVWDPKKLPKEAAGQRSAAVGSEWRSGKKFMCDFGSSR